MIEFRRATPDDAPQLHEFMRAFNVEQGFDWHPGMAAAMDRLLSDPGLGRAWVIDVEGKSGGYVALCFGFSLEFRGPDAFVDELYLKPELRGKGLGRETLTFITHEAKRLGLRALHLEVAHGDAKLVRLYESLGYRERPHPFRTLILEP